MITDINSFINHIIFYFINHLSPKFNSLNRFVIIPLFKIISFIYNILEPFLNEFNSLLLKISNPIYFCLNDLNKLITLLVYKLLIYLILFIKNKYGIYFLMIFLLVLVCYCLSSLVIYCLIYFSQKTENFKLKIKKYMILLLKLSSLLIIICAFVIFTYHRKATSEAITAIFLSLFIYIEEFTLISHNQLNLQNYSKKFSEKLSNQQEIELSVIRRNCYSSLTIDNIEIFSIIFGEIFVTKINEWLNLTVIFIIVIVSFVTFIYIIKSNLRQCCSYLYIKLHSH